MRPGISFDVQCAELINAFGSDSVATRGARAVVRRLGIDTLEALRAEQERLGEREFELVLYDLPGVGDHTRKRIMDAVNATDPEAA